jgi:hypothetical protein
VLRERALDLAGVRAELDRLVARGVLLGPYRDDTELLRGLGIDLQAVRDIVTGAFGAATVEEAARRVARRGAGRTPPWSWPAMSKGLVAKRALQLAVEEAEAMGRSEAGPEHVLLGVLRDAQMPVKVPRCFRLPRSRQSRAYRGQPEPDRPNPVTAVLEARNLTPDTLRQAVLAELHTTA